MGASPDHAIAYRSSELAPELHARWLQAGFSSFAYRLAHLAVPRGASLVALIACFYLV
jgi:hypothetical protein